MRYRPMLAVLGSEKDLKKENFIFEPKLDGYRALCYKNGKLKFVSRNGIDFTADYPELDFLKRIKAKSAVIDGEIVAFNEKGNPDFQEMQRRKKDDDIMVSFVAFDILMKDGKDLTDLPLSERKDILAKTINGGDNLFLTEFTFDSAKLLKFMRKRWLEGIIAKKYDGRYIQSRSTDWVKIKFVKTIDCVILGYTSQKNKVSSLLLGLYVDGKLRFAGKVGTGFTTAIRKYLEERFSKLEVLRPPVDEEVKEKNVTWLKPKLVCEVHFSQVTSDKKLRAPSYKGLREDKNPEECKLEEQI